MTEDDGPQRKRALTELKSTLVVEAAAGTGKTSLLAGRVVALLADGVKPENIAAISFTDFAASELRARINRFVAELRTGTVPRDLHDGFPDVLRPEQQAALRNSADYLDELTCATIHGFCHSLLDSYAVEATIDPGATILDGEQAEFAFRTAFDQWLNRRLGDNAAADDPLTFMAQWDPRAAVRTLRDLGRFRRRFKSATPVAGDLDTAADRDFVAAVRGFRQWFDGTPRPDHAANDLAELEELAAFYEGAFEPCPTFARLWTLAHPKRIKAMRWKSFDFSPYRRETVWRKAAGQERGNALHAEAASHYARCAETFRVLIGRIANYLVGTYCAGTDALIADYESFKRNAAVIDFDDLLVICRRLLRTREDVRAAISKKYTRILVDEFQDTDRIQTEILFLIGSAAGAADTWQRRALTPGGLFLVGDPKQAIYRFRGADVAAYIEARDAIERQFPKNILHITSNFRSRAEILRHVNGCFAQPLGRHVGRYVPLHPTLGPAAHGLPCVARTLVGVSEESKLEVKREAEAKHVAELCARLIGNVSIRRSDETVSPLVPGDIALLTPATTQVWQYEHELEERGLPFISQAGKNLFRRQETQDFVALVRTLADPRDTLALGALLRGPLVELTEHELLDIVAHLPDPATAGDLPRLSVTTAPELIQHERAREVLTILRDLRRRARGTTPFLLLSEAFERFRVHAIVAQRGREQATRALANVALLLQRSRAYAVHGLARLARDLGADWQETEPCDEARLEGSREAIQIITVHSAKGLEWPVVIPINMASQFRRRDPFIYRRRDNSLHWVLGDIVPPGMADAIQADDHETREERERLLYVACTRAVDLLILPQISASSNSWAQLLDLKLETLPEIDVSRLRPQRGAQPDAGQNAQTAEVFKQEQAKIESAIARKRWLRPSDEDPDRQALDALVHEPDEDIDVGAASVGGGRTRGLLLHKLMEELLTGVLPEERESIAARSVELLAQLGSAGAAIDPSEAAGTALRTLRLPAISERRTAIVPELAIFAAWDEATLVAGRADAIAYENGAPTVVFDWKSDVAPSDRDRLSHKAQALAYARATGAKRGAVVYMSLDEIQWIERT